MSRVRVPEGVPKRPVGQVVKTEASHAFNIGSNPVRVTTSKQAAYRSLPAEAESLLIPLLLLYRSQPLRWVARGREKFLTGTAERAKIHKLLEREAL